MFTGYREFDAYARSLRRTVWARQFEQAAKSISDSTLDVTIGDLLAEPAQAPRTGHGRRDEPAAAR